MRVLFDQGTPSQIAPFLRKHEVVFARDIGWDELANGNLLSAAEAAGFDVLLTTDNGFAHQQNLKGRGIAIVILSRNRLELVQRSMRKIVAAIDQAQPGMCISVDIPVR